MRRRQPRRSTTPWSECFHASQGLYLIASFARCGSHRKPPTFVVARRKGASARCLLAHRLWEADPTLGGLAQPTDQRVATGNHIFRWTELVVSVSLGRIAWT